MFKRKRKTKEEIGRIKNDLLKLMGWLLLQPDDAIPMTTKEAFEFVGVNYKNEYEKDSLYNIIRDCRDSANKLWSFDIIDGNKEVNNKIYKDWLDKCYLENEPYLFLENGITICPKTFEEDERLLGQIATNKLLGVGSAFKKLSNKSMSLGDLSGRRFLSGIDDLIKLLPKGDED